MLHICGRIDSMYLGSDFHRYWARCGQHKMHPDDVAYLRDSPFVHDLLPCPFDGPLDKAKVVICLANPSYGEVQDQVSLNRLLLEMRSGEEELPEMFDAFYRKITRPMELPLEEVRKVVAVFNVCPYSSAEMNGRTIRVAAGLPSVWQAQNFLRQVLVPRAQTGNIYLVLLRKHQLWGVTEGAEMCGNLHVVSGHAMGGVMPAELGKKIGAWLDRKWNVSGTKASQRLHERLKHEN